MLHSDAQRRDDNKDIRININVISEIERELSGNPYDMISLVFLLYDIPDTALQRLIVFQRVSKEVGCTNLNLLQEWYQYAKSKPNWQHEFLEALLICQLYGIVRKLGFHVPSLKQQYQPDNINIHVHISPLKKALYMLGENLSFDNLKKLKKSLYKSYNIDTTDHESCEMVFLELMCQKLITVNQIYYDKKVVGCDFQIDKLTYIIQNLPGLKKIATEIHNLQSALNDEPSKTTSPSPNDLPVTADVTAKGSNNNNENNAYDVNEIFEMFNQLNVEEINNKNLKSDTKKLSLQDYEIKDPKRVGVCIIINQEEFYPSNQSIKENGKPINLADRLGSTKDMISLIKTMTSFNFKVYSRRNLDRDEIFEYLGDIIHNKVHENDSIFMLCILSHGVRGHVYAADSLKVKVENIQKYLDSDDMKQVRGIPKVMIIQACQVDDTPCDSNLVTDGPSNCYLGKSDYLIYWATAPEYEAFRDEKQGSIFIQHLCGILKQQVRKEHLYVIFTMVTDKVSSTCSRLHRAQLPIFESTLRKNLYLQIPE